VRPVSPRIASADFMKRRSRGSVSTPPVSVLDVTGRAAPADRPLGFAIVDTFRLVVVYW